MLSTRKLNVPIGVSMLVIPIKIALPTPKVAVDPFVEVFNTTLLKSCWYVQNCPTLVVDQTAAPVSTIMP